MSKVIQITPPNNRFRSLLAESISTLEKMKGAVIEETHRLASSASVRVISHETDEEPVAFKPDLRPVDQEALAALAGLSDHIGETVATLARVAEGKGQAFVEAEQRAFLVDTDLLEVLGSRDGIRGWLEDSDLSGKGPRPIELLSLDSLTLESIENGRRIIAIGTGVDANGESAKVRVVTDENAKRDIDQYLAPMRGTWEWLPAAAT